MMSILERSRMESFRNCILMVFAFMQISASIKVADALNITLEFDQLQEGATFITKSSTNATFNYSHPLSEEIRMKMTSADKRVADTDEDGVVLQPCNATVCEMTVDIQSYQIGRSYFNFTFYQGDIVLNASIEGTWKYSVRVIRKYDPLTANYGYIILTLQIILHFLLGCKLNLNVVRNRLKKPIAVLLGIACQILLMPLLAFSLTKSFNLSNVLALGLLVMGCSPGGSSSNYYSILLNGDVDLSIAMTLFTITLSFGTMPLWLFIYSSWFTQGLYPVRVPYTQILITVITAIVPLFPGLLLRKCKPTWTRKLTKVLIPFVLLLVLFSTVVGIWNGIYIWEMMTWQNTISSLLLPVLGMTLGAIVAAVFRRDFPQIKTIAVETGVQNTVIAQAVVRLSQPQPEADVMLLMPAYTGLFTIVFLLIAYVFHIILLRCSSRYEKLHEGYLNRLADTPPENMYSLEQAMKKEGVDNKAMQVDENVLEVATKEWDNKFINKTK